MIRAVIIDDEELSTILLEKKLQEFPIIQVVKTYCTQERLLEDLVKEPIDVVFLDIEMGEANGLDLAETIQSIQPSIQLVFVTAHSDYAVQAFELNSIDYLLKPTSTKRLYKTIERLSKLVGKKKEILNQPVDIQPLRINCFHELQVFNDDKLIHFKSAKVKELFAYLFTHLNKYIHKDIIIEDLWPDQDYKKSKIHLHTCLSHLRKMLGSLGYSNCISFSNHCYSLELNPIQCDVIEFDESLNYFSVINETNRHKATEIIDLYKGTYLEMNHYEWATDVAQQYHEKILHLLDMVIDFFRSNNPNKALFYLQRQLKLSPYLERSIKESMQILVKQGYRSEAVKLYKEFEILLQDDLGIKPERSLEQFYGSLLTQKIF